MQRIGLGVSHWNADGISQRNAQCNLLIPVLSTRFLLCGQMHYFCRCPTIKRLLEKRQCTWKSSLQSEEVYSSFYDRTKRLLQISAFRKQSRQCLSQDFCAWQYSTSSTCTNLGSPPLPKVIPPHSFFIGHHLGQKGRFSNLSKQHHNTLMHEWFRRIRLPVELLPLESHVSRGYSHVWLLAFTKSFVWLVCCVVGSLMPHEKPLCFPLHMLFRHFQKSWR